MEKEPWRNLRLFLFFNAKSSASFMEGGERYGIPSGKKRQTAWHLPKNAV